MAWLGLREAGGYIRGSGFHRAAGRRSLWFGVRPRGGLPGRSGSGSIVFGVRPRGGLPGRSGSGSIVFGVRPRGGLRSRSGSWSIDSGSTTRWVGRNDEPRAAFCFIASNFILMFTLLLMNQTFSIEPMIQIDEGV